MYHSSATVARRLEVGIHSRAAYRSYITCHGVRYSSPRRDDAMASRRRTAAALLLDRPQRFCPTVPCVITTQHRLGVLHASRRLASKCSSPSTPSSTVPLVDSPLAASPLATCATRCSHAEGRSRRSFEHSRDAGILKADQSDPGVRLWRKSHVSRASYNHYQNVICVLIKLT